MISFTGAFILGTMGLNDLTQCQGAVEAEQARCRGTAGRQWRLNGMAKLSLHSVLLVAAFPLVVTACDQNDPPFSVESDVAASPKPSLTGKEPIADQQSGVPTAPAQAVPTPPSPSTTPTFIPESEKGEKGARAVLLTWARALENRRFGEAWAQFLDPPASRDAFVKWWERYATLTVAVPGGEMDAGAGSLYYTVLTTITGTTQDGRPFRLTGDVVLRRVNDVDGATPQQLRWHLASADLKSVAP
jgi:hypothetical protein